jgi:hypothetical protein
MKTDIAELLDGMTSLERDINDRAKEHRLQIVLELLRTNPADMPVEAVINDATKLTDFIERGPKSTYERIALPHAKKALKEKKQSQSAIVKWPKRKYTKRSKFWGKK